MTSMPNGFGTLLKRLRVRQGLSQLELANCAGVSSRHLSFLETGRAKPSAAMVSRLAAAMMVGAESTDDLLVAAGFCRSNAGRRTRSAGEHVLESALTMDEAPTASQLVEAGQSALRPLGIDQFFFATISCNPEELSDFGWNGFEAFPVSWLRFYDRERYAKTDPLLSAARARREGFFWEEVVDRRSLDRQARDMFERAASAGLMSGFVVPRRNGSSIHLVSMMGRAIDAQSRTIRFALEVLGSRMLSGLDRLAALPVIPSVP